MMSQYENASQNSPAPKKERVILSKRDVDKLLEDCSTGSKIELLNKITAVYNEGDEGLALTKSELAMVEDIFRVLVKTAEKEVRVAFSNGVKSSTTIPEDIVRSLARDIDDVAIPVLEFSEVLDEDELLDIIESGESTRRCVAIAKRQYVSQKLSSKLAEKDETVVEILLKNFGADISDATYTRIIETRADSETIVSAMVEKGTIPITVMEKLLRHVSGSMRKELDEKYHVVFESKQLKKEMEHNLYLASMKMMGLRSQDAQHRKMLRMLDSGGKTSVFTSLCNGDLNAFEIGLSRLCHISINNVRILINDLGGNGFKSLYKKAGLPHVLLEATEVVLKAVQTLEAENFIVKEMRIRITPKTIIERMKFLGGDRKVDHLDFLIFLMEDKLK